MAALLPAPPLQAAGRAACAGADAVTAELRVVPGALRGRDDEQLVVRLHADGCVVVQRPWYLKNAGVRELHLDAGERQRLQGKVGAAALREVSRRALQVEARSAQVSDKATAPAVAVNYFSPDADRYLLSWRDGATMRSVDWPGVPDAAARQPKSAALNALADAVRALRALSQREGGRTVAGGTP